MRTVFDECIDLSEGAFVQEKIDKNGRLTDQKTKEKIGELLVNLVSWTKRLKGA